MPIIAMPIASSVHLETDFCIQRDIARGYDFVCVEGCGHIDMARGLLAGKALSLVRDVVVFIDSDMRWEESDIDGLVNACKDLFEKRWIPLLHGTYAQRGKKGNVCHQRVEVQVLELPASNLVPVVGGLGFCAIHRAGFIAFANQCERYRVVSADAIAINMFPTGIIKGDWYGEDILHCLKQFKIGHGSYWIDSLVVEHMASEYAVDGKRYPSQESLETLRAK